VTSARAALPILVLALVWGCNGALSGWMMLVGWCRSRSRHPFSIHSRSVPSSRGFQSAAGSRSSTTSFSPERSRTSVVHACAIVMVEPRKRRSDVGMHDA
jgi:hypothetical protein